MPNQYVSYGCCPIVDGCRTIAYLKWAQHIMAPNACGPGSGIVGTCDCCVEQTDESDAVIVYEDPINDPAPWYSPNDPRSGYYLGAALYSWDESQPYIRETVDSLVGSKAKGAKLRKKEIVARFILAVSDACAVPFAKAYFMSQITCASSDDGSCGLPPLEWHECYTPTDCDDTAHAFRGLPRTAVTSVEWLDDEIEACLGVVAEVTFASELPWVYELCPDSVTENLNIVGGEPFCNFCGPACPEASDPCENPCFTDIVVPPSEIPQGCYCEPIEVYKNCFNIRRGGRIGEDTLKITVYTGQFPLSSLRIQGWANPLNVDDSSVFECVDPCLDIAIPGPIPAFSTLVIDGMTRRALLTCNNNTQNGRSWIESPDGAPFQWPDVGCDGLMLCLTSNAATVNGVPQTAADATISIERYHRELR
jgi:hypothetical protein